MAPKLPLKYKRDFNPNMGRNAKISTFVTIETDNGSQKIITKSSKVRVFTGTTVEELCFTRYCFDQAAENLNVETKNLKEEFIKILSPTPRKKWGEMIEKQDDNGTLIGDTRDKFTQALGLFTNMFATDKNSKQLMMEVIIKGTGGFYFKDDEEETDIGKNFD